MKVSKVRSQSGVARSAFRAPRSLIRPLVEALHPYVPGEQPKVKGLIKLNTNENPYPPSPRVLRAVRSAVDGRLRLYPDPSAEPLRIRLARLHRCKPENIIVGNGSDELLALATRAFVEPRSAERGTRNASRVSVQYFTPSYSLYPVLAAIHGAAQNPIHLNPDFSLPAIRELRWGKAWDFRAALTFITTPNAPSGRGYTTTELDALCRSMKGVVVLDEAYADFARENALALALEYPHVIVSRTFSKAYSLCFQRIGYFVGHPQLIGALQKIRDSRKHFEAIVATREKVRARLTGLGFEVLPSQTNFLLAKPPGLPAEAWLEKLRARRILVRWFAAPGLRNALRITIGTPGEMEQLIREASRILKAGS